MIDHVSARCDKFRLLFPTRNIESIVPIASESLLPFAGTRRHAHGAHDAQDAHNEAQNADAAQGYALDLRHLLSGQPPPYAPSCIRLEWVSTDAERRVSLIVDSVDEIVNSPHGHLEPLPMLSQRLLRLCDGVLHNPDGTYRISVKLDVAWPMRPLSEGRLCHRAFVSLKPEAQSSSSKPA